MKNRFSFYAEGNDCQVDSRLIKKGGIFFALKGLKTDGHKFLEEAILKGAKTLVIDENFDFQQGIHIEVVKSKDVLGDLQALAKEELKKHQVKKIGVTGSFGKSTTCEFIYTLLKDKKVSKTYKNYNSQIGFPISLLNMDKKVDFLVLEMAMDQKAEIIKLVDIAPLDIALITGLVEFHDNFESIQDLAYAKKEIFSDKNTKFKIINKTIKYLKAFKKESFLTYSIEDQKADFYLDVKNKKFFEEGKQIDCVLPFEEKHLLENLTAALAVCRIAGLDYNSIFKNLKMLKTVEMRFEKQFLHGVLFIKDYYNASLNSTIAALNNLPKTKGKKIAVLATHLGLGKHSLQAHRQIIKIAKQNVDEILCLGEVWKDIQGIKIFDKHEKLANSLDLLIEKDDVVLIKGSRVMQMEKILDLMSFRKFSIMK